MRHGSNKHGRKEERLARVTGEEFPEGFAGVYVVGSFADEHFGQVLFSAGPGVAPAFDGVDDDFGVFFAG